MWTDAELGYLAGILDGEGTITIFRSKNKCAATFQQIVTVETTSKILSDWLLTHFGGQVYFRERPAVMPNGIQSKRSRWKWNLRKAEIDAIFPAIRPYMVIKAEHVDLMIEFRSLMSHDGSWAHRWTPTENMNRRTEIAHRFPFINLTKKSSS